MAISGPARSMTGTRGIETGAMNAYTILHIAFSLIPLLAGLDKFAHVLVNWDQYLAPIVPSTLGISAHTFMMGVGVVEIVAGLIVAFKPRIGAYIVGAWLAGIVVNLAMNPVHYWDVAVRDFGLMLGAFSLGSLSAWVDAKNSAKI